MSREQLEEQRHREWMRKLSQRGMGYGNAATEVKEEESEKKQVQKVR